ncbi:GH116 family glycosyl hydrolase [Bacteroidota bacterium]
MNRSIFFLLTLLVLTSCGEESTKIDLEYTDQNLRYIQCPLGGIGTGNILLNGYGAISEFEFFNRVDKDEAPPYMTFFSLYAKEDEAPAVVCVMEGEYLSEFPNPFGKPRQQLGGLPRFKNAVFHNAYPVVGVDLEDEKVPLDVRMEAWSPFIPVDPENSQLPVAIVEWELHNPGKKSVSYSIALAMGNPLKGMNDNNYLQSIPCTITPYRREEWKGFTFSSLDEKNLSNSNRSVRVLFPSEGKLSTPMYSGGWWDNAHIFWEDFSKDGALSPRADTLDEGDDKSAASMFLQGTLSAGETVRIPFVFSWYVPYRKLENNQAFGNREVEGSVVDNYYAKQFNSIDAVESYLLKKFTALKSKTFAFSDAMVNSTVPEAVLDAAISNMSSLKTNLIMRDGSGHVHGYEGLGNDFGCCAGNCTHVWNYAQTMAALFPSLERNVREIGFTHDTHENGYQRFRSVFPLSDYYFKSIAADGQMGNIMRVYREWKMLEDNAWLGEIWPKVKLALEFAWKGIGEVKQGDEWMYNCPVPWDPNKEGVLRGDQHNTYDINFFGPNMMTGSLYLGALKACSEMAIAMNEPQKSMEYQLLYEKGRGKYMELLWNGSYFTQQVEVIDGVRIPERLQSPPDANGKVIPKYQYGEGCLSDQLLGQYLAFVSGMGYLMDTSVIRTTLQSIYTHNFREEMRDFANVQRIYAANEEPGLVICSWPNGNKPVLPFVYADEVWTGVEYEVATSMIYAGLKEEGLKVTEGVRARYTGSNRNPFAEIESGRHYARALASWGVYQGFAGYSYDGGMKQMKFKPAEDVLPVRYFWSTGRGWGTIDISRAAIKLRCLHGTLELEELLLGGKSFFVLRDFIPTYPTEVDYADTTLILRFPNELVLAEGEEYRMDLP